MFDVVADGADRIWLGRIRTPQGQAPTLELARFLPGNSQTAPSLADTASVMASGSSNADVTGGVDRVAPER